MKQPRRSILVPVLLDDEYLAVARQAAEFAGHQHAGIHLLHIEPREPFLQRIFYNKRSRQRLYKKTNQKIALLNTWKTILESQTGTPVTFDVDWGDPARMYLHYAKTQQTDMIIIKEDIRVPKWHNLKKSVTAYIISHFSGQVITLKPGNHRIADWRQVIITVTDFIPEIRIEAMVTIARQFGLKIHLVSSTYESVKHNPTEFYFLTETLKRFKAAGNISVECTCLPVSGNRTERYLSYCRGIGADVLMTYQPSREADIYHQPALYVATINPMTQLS